MAMKRSLDQVTAASQDTSPTESQSKLVKLPGDTCSHCMKRCTSKGKSSDAIQCEICYRWVHASCEGIPKEKYKLFNQVVGEIPNLVYCCKYNQCYSRLNQFTSVANHDSLVNISQDLKVIGEQYGVLKTTVSKLGSQIEELSQNNLSLKKKFNDLLSSQKQPQATGNISSSQELSTATTIAEELAERERKKNNIIIYNFPEDTAERDKLLKMCKDSTDLDIKIHKLFRLGRKTDNKARPLLVALESEVEKLELLSRAPKLRFHEEYKNIFIAQDMTKLQRLKHKKLVEELKKRKQQGEVNLIIKNGTIMKRQPRRQPEILSEPIPPIKQPSLIDLADQCT